MDEEFMKLSNDTTNVVHPTGKSKTAGEKPFKNENFLNIKIVWFFGFGFRFTRWVNSHFYMQL
jgi:hypothetical protein